jgi:hypothetical protein
MKQSKRNNNNNTIYYGETSEVENGFLSPPASARARNSGKTRATRSSSKSSPRTRSLSKSTARTRSNYTTPEPSPPNIENDRSSVSIKIVKAVVQTILRTCFY